MRKTYKILLIVAALIALLVIAVAVAISPVAKNYIEKHDRELLGRTIRMERLRANIFTGRVRVEQLRIGGADDSTTFFSLDSFDMQIRLLPLLFREVDIRHIRLSEPDVKVYQMGNKFNFDGILDHFRGDTTEVADTLSEPWKIGIYNISIRDGRLFYNDLALDAKWGMNNINLQIPGVYFSGAKTDVGVILNFADGGSLNTTVAYDIASSAFDIGVKLQNFALGGTLPYFRQSLDVAQVDGSLSADIRLQGNTEHLLSLRTEGVASLADFELLDNQQRAVFKVDSLGIDLKEADLGQMKFRFDRVFVQGFSTFFELTPDGNNFTALLRPSPAATPAADGTESAATPAPSLHISDLELTNGRITLRDLTLERPFEYAVSDIRMHSRDFDPSIRNNLTIEARMQKTGSAKFRWEGSLDDMNNHNITLLLTNLNMRDFSPYCEHYTAYPLTSGNLSFRSQNIIRNRYLDGTNHLDVYEPKVDKKRKDLKPELHIPLKLGLYVLKDKKGHVKMDLPVKGSLDSPDFSYRKIVMKAIGNVLLKVVTAPFSFLSGNHENLQYIAVDPQQYAFTSEQYASFDKIGELIKEKPEMQFALTQRINLGRALPAQAADALKLAYVNHLRSRDTMRAIQLPGKDPATMQPGGTPQLSLLEYEKILQTDIRTPEVVAFADTLLAARGIPAHGLSAGEKALKLYREEAMQQLQSFVAMRDKALNSYMRTTHGVSELQFKLTPLDSIAAQSYTGRDRYTIAIGVDGETAEVGAENADSLHAATAPHPAISAK